MEWESITTVMQHKVFEGKGAGEVGRVDSVQQSYRLEAPRHHNVAMERECYGWHKCARMGSP